MNVTQETLDVFTLSPTVTVMDGQHDFENSGVFSKHEFLHTRPWAAFPTIVVLSVASFVGTAGNVLTLLAIASNKSVRNIESMFIVNLAISDLYVTTVADPMSIIAKLEGEHFFDGIPRLCQIIAKLCTISCVTSLLTIATMSLNRYIYVCHNSHYKKIFSKRNSVIICMSVYCVGLVLVLLNQAGIGDHSFDRKSLECIWDRMATFPYTVVYSVTLVWIPCVVIGICYLRLYFFVNMHKKKILNHKKKNGVNSPGAGIPSKPKLQLAKTFILIYAVFVTCWAPYALLIILDHKDAFLHEVHVYVTVWAHLHPSVNWLIYYFTQRKLADAYRQILGCGMYQNKRSQRGNPSPAETSDERPIERRPFENHRIAAVQQNNQQLSRDSPVMEWKPIATLSAGNLKKFSNNNINIYHKLYEEMRAIHSEGEVQGYIHKGSFKGESYINMRASQSVGDLPENLTEYEGPRRKTSSYTESGLVQELCGIVRNLQSVMISHTFNTDTGVTCEICDKTPVPNLNPVLQDESVDTVTEPKSTEEACEYPAPAYLPSDNSGDTCVKYYGVNQIGEPIKEDSGLKSENASENIPCSDEKAVDFGDGDRTVFNRNANVPYENLFELYSEQTESEFISENGSAESLMSFRSATDSNLDNTGIQEKTIEKEAIQIQGHNHTK